MEGESRMNRDEYDKNDWKIFIKFCVCDIEIILFYRNILNNHYLWV